MDRILGDSRGYLDVAIDRKLLPLEATFRILDSITASLTSSKHARSDPRAELTHEPEIQPTNCVRSKFAIFISEIQTVINFNVITNLIFLIGLLSCFNVQKFSFCLNTSVHSFKVSYANFCHGLSGEWRSAQADENPHHIPVLIIVNFAALAICFFFCRAFKNDVRPGQSSESRLQKFILIN